MTTQPASIVPAQARYSSTERPLARNSAEWYRLVELAALAGVLIADDSAIYDPRLFNDRLLLGLRGTVSEIELHCIEERLRGARHSKAQRGELHLRLPAGYVYAD